MRAPTKRPHTAAGVVLALTTFAVPLTAAERSHEDQVTAGRDLALIVCSACHVVARDQPYPVSLTHPAPAFEAIANRPDTTAASLQRFLSGTHWDMQTLSYEHARSKADG